MLENCEGLRLKFQLSCHENWEYILQCWLQLADGILTLDSFKLRPSSCQLVLRGFWVLISAAAPSARAHRVYGSNEVRQGLQR